MEFPPSTYCARFQSSLELLGARWTPAILRVLMHAPSRFSDLLAAVPRMSSRLLSQRLDELTAAGIVARDCRSNLYQLTDKGHALRPVFETLEDWNQQWARSTT